jgi:ABC-type lipoprotein release transport system permease subunit
VQAVEKRLDYNEFEVINWEKMIPALVETRQLKEGSSNLILYILYFIISFALFGTILMMSKERELEFGILVSIGMQRWKLMIGVWLETIFLGLIGSISGIFLSIPMCYYFKKNPIDMGALGGEELVEVYENFGIDPVLPFAFEFNIFFEQALIMFIITTILALYPLVKIFRLKPVEAMRA